MSKVSNILKNNNQYYEGRSKKVILLVHGFTGSIDDLDIFFDFFKDKDYTVVRPSLSGHNEDIENILKYGPVDWENEVLELIEYFSKGNREIYMIGVSFGGNIGMKISSYHEKIKGLITLETPIKMILKTAFMMNVLQRICEICKIEKINKSKFIFRKNYQKSDGDNSLNFFPIKSVGLVRDYIKENRKTLNNIKIPYLVMSALKSDLLHKNNLDIIYENIASEIKEKIIMPIDNHDLNYMEESGKVMMLEKIYGFIRNI